MRKKSLNMPTLCDCEGCVYVFSKNIHYDAIQLFIYYSIKESISKDTHFSVGPLQRSIHTNTKHTVLGLTFDLWLRHMWV